MKRILAVLSVAALLFSMAACGGKTPAVTEESTSVSESETQETTTVISGTLKEMEGFNAVCPEGWSRLTYQNDANRLEFYKTPSAPDIKKDTPMVKILVDKEAATEENVESAVHSLMHYSDVTQGKDKQIDGHAFKFVAYTNTDSKLRFYVLTGLVGGHLVTITLRAISPNDEQAQDILNSIEFK